KVFHPGGVSECSHGFRCAPPVATTLRPLPGLKSVNGAQCTPLLRSVANYRFFFFPLRPGFVSPLRVMETSLWAADCRRFQSSPIREGAPGASPAASVFFSDFSPMAGAVGESFESLLSSQRSTMPHTLLAMK